MKPTKIALQVVGSPTSSFFFDLSMLYAREVVTPAGFTLLFVIAYPDGKWAVREHLDQLTPKLSFGQMVERVRSATLFVPHLFCPAGLTTWRIFFEEVLGIPGVGSTGQTLLSAQNKQLTKWLATDAQVPVPKGFCMSNKEIADNRIAELDFPVIVKPNTSDNSDGLNLVRNRSVLNPALQEAFHYDTEVLVEQYIAGREIRGAVLEQAGIIRVLPFIEYGVHPQNPIRQRADKLKFNEWGDLLAQSDKEKIPAHCPAVLDKVLHKKLTQLWTQMHRKLGCRDFSMYDFRIDRDTQRPYLLEAGLFWSFSPTSMISSMLRAEGTDLTETTRLLWEQASRRSQRRVPQAV